MEIFLTNAIEYIYDNSLSIEKDIYSDYSENEEEKIHYFETDLINNLLKETVAENTNAIVDFSTDLWTAYIDEFSITKIPKG